MNPTLQQLQYTATSSQRFATVGRTCPSGSALRYLEHSFVQEDYIIVDLPAYNSTYLIQVYNLRVRIIWVYNDGQSSPHTWRLFRVHSASPSWHQLAPRPEVSIAQRQVKMVAKRVLVCAWPLGMPLLWSLCNVKANMLQPTNKVKLHNKHMQKHNSMIWYNRI